jgi:hypothetical protein
MIIEIQTQPYDATRYGRPYIAVISYRYSALGDAERWGTWDGEHGQAGVLQIEAQPGDVLMIGRTDSVGQGRRRRWYLVEADLSLRSVRREDGMFAQGNFKNEANHRS